MAKEEKTIKNELQEKLKALKKKFGDNPVMLLSETAQKKVPVVSTGSLALNYALGIGGYPKGRIIEIYGQEASGKTTLALMGAVEAQKQGMNVLFVDTEHALNMEYAIQLGLNPNDENAIVGIAQPDYGEQALELVEEVLDEGLFQYIVVDSVSALVPRAELEGSMDDSQIGLQARLMGKALRKLAGKVSKTGAVLIFINQVREKVGGVSFYGPTEVTTGGRALKFFSSIRLAVKRGETLKEDGKPIGHVIKIQVVKNKFAPPYKEATINLIYGKGIDKYAELFDLAVQKKIIQRSGSYYRYEDEVIGQGRNAVIEYLKSNEDIAKEIYQKLFSD